MDFAMVMMSPFSWGYAISVEDVPNIYPRKPCKLSKIEHNRCSYLYHSAGVIAGNDQRADDLMFSVKNSGTNCLQHEVWTAEAVTRRKA